jgi:predicted nucleic acid-binding protein
LDRTVSRQPKGTEGQANNNRCGRSKDPRYCVGRNLKKYVREKAEMDTVKSRLETITSASLVTPVEIEVAMKAGEASIEVAAKAAKQRRKAPSLFDAIVLATVRVHDSKVLTGDEHFEGLPDTILI